MIYPRGFVVLVWIHIYVCNRWVVGASVFVDTIKRVGCVGVHLPDHA